MSTEKWTEPDSEAEALAEGFFSSFPAPLDDGAESWEATPMSPANRRAMIATLSLLGCCAAAGLAFALLSDHVRVAPAELAGTASHAALATWTAPPSEAPHVAAQPPPARAAAKPAERTAELDVTEPDSRAPEAPRKKPEAAVAAGPGAAAQDNDAQQLTRRAYRQLGQGNPREAEQLANLALLRDGSRAETYIVLAGARDALGNVEGARSAMRACVQHARDPLANTCKTLVR